MSKISKVLEELAKRADMGDEVAKRGITAYHGTPHAFDKFSMDSIGTGEGAQAYGHGLYFAESEDVAQGYRDALKRLDRTDLPVPEQQALSVIEDVGGDLELAIKSGRDEMSSAVGTSNEQIMADRQSALEGFRERGVPDFKYEGSMYQVEIDANQDELLDWDLPLSEQSEGVREKLSGLKENYEWQEKFPIEDVKGSGLYAMGAEGSLIKGADNLKNAGIKGIRYKDGFSRGEDGGTSNYVIFDDRLISISKKYGISIPAAAAVLGGTMTPEEASASDGGMGVQSAPESEEEIPWAQPTGGELMDEANREFAQATNGPGLGSIQQMLMNGIMQTAGMVDPGADVASSMAGPLLSAPGAIARYAADKFVPGTEYSAEDISQARQGTEDYFNYSPRTELGAQYGEEAMQAFGGAVAPYMQDLSDAAGNSSILGAMKQGYNYLGDKEKELAKAMMDISPI